MLILLIFSRVKIERREFKNNLVKLWKRDLLRGSFKSSFLISLLDLVMLVGRVGVLGRVEEVTVFLWFIKLDLISISSPFMIIFFLRIEVDSQEGV